MLLLELLLTWSSHPLLQGCKREAGNSSPRGAILLSQEGRGLVAGNQCTQGMKHKNTRGKGSDSLFKPQGSTYVFVLKTNTICSSRMFLVPQSCSCSSLLLPLLIPFITICIHLCVSLARLKYWENKPSICCLSLYHNVGRSRLLIHGGWMNEFTVRWVDNR